MVGTFGALLHACDCRVPRRQLPYHVVPGARVGESRLDLPRKVGGHGEPCIVGLVLIEEPLHLHKPTRATVSPRQRVLVGGTFWTPAARSFPSSQLVNWLEVMAFSSTRSRAQPPPERPGTRRFSFGSRLLSYSTRSDRSAIARTSSSRRPRS
jgi:hypothetical protein